MEVTTVYLICLVGGLVYAGLTLIFSGGNGDHGGVLDGLFGHHNGGGDAGAGHAAVTGPVHVNFLSPLFASTFLMGFGAIGLIALHGLQLSPMLATGIAALASFTLSFGLHWALANFFVRAQSSNIEKTEDIIGLQAEVLAAVSQEAPGEILYTTASGRHTLLARCIEQEEIPKGSQVQIYDMVGGVALVRRRREL